MRMGKITVQQTTLEECMQQFLKAKEAQKKSASTMKDYYSYLNTFLSASSNSMEYDILNEEVLTFFANIPDTSPARYNHPYQYLKSFFNWCVKNDYLPKNPIVANDLHKKADEGNIKPASIEDVKKLLNSFDKTNFCDYRNYIITLLMLDTGIRTSELRRLKDGDYDATAKQITISKQTAKGRKSRIIFLSDSTARALNKYLKVKPEGWSELLFPTREGNEMTSNGMAREFDRRCKKIGIKFTPYQLRHTFATYFVENGGNIFALQDLMGHSDIKMTRRYTEISNSQKQEQHRAYTPMNLLNTTSRLTRV